MRSVPTRLGATLLLGLLTFGCADDRPDVTSPVDQQPDISVLYGQGVLRSAIAAQERATADLMSLPSVVGTGVGVTAEGQPVIKIFVEDARVSGLPSSLDGIPVAVEVTGEFHALQVEAEPRAKPVCGKRGLPPCPPPLNARHPRPVPIGVSTGHPAITAGTLGARVTDGTNVYALSNNHVYADENQASINDAVIQPGTFDGGSSPADDIGTLARFEPIVFGGACVNVIDAAIAATTVALVDNSTPPGVGYGTPRSTTVAPAVNMSVKKVGRTTGFTKGSITAINATVNVGYSGGVACFTGQIVVTPGNFSAGGDSGSLVVFDGKGRTKNDDRKPVGLLYAGSASATILNPIDEVLARFNVTIDGN